MLRQLSLPLISESNLLYKVAEQREVFTGLRLRISRLLIPVGSLQRNEDQSGPFHCNRNGLQLIYRQRNENLLACYGIPRECKEKLKNQALQR